MMLSNYHIVKTYTHTSHSLPIQTNDYKNILILKMRILKH